MHTNEPLLYNNVNVAEWVYQRAVDGKNGRGKSIYINQSSTNKSNPVFQLPKCRVPFGVRGGLEQKPDAPRMNMELSVEDPNMIDFLKDIDQHNIRILMEQSEACFGRPKSRAVLEEGIYRSVLQYSNSGDYAPLCRTKVCVDRSADGVGEDSKPRRMRQTNVMVVERENKDGEVVEYSPGTLADIQPHCMVLTVIEVGGLWIVNGKCGFSFVVTHVMVWPQKAILEFPFKLAGQRPRKVQRGEICASARFDPIDMETTVVNMPCMEDETMGEESTTAVALEDNSYGPSPPGQ